MAALLPCAPNIVSAPFGNRSTSRLPNRPQSHAFSGSTRHFLRGSLSVARFGFKPEFLPEPEHAEGVLRELFGRAEGLLYTIADAAVSSSSDTVAASATAKQSNDWLSGITNYMETVLKVLKDGLSALHVPYAYGFAIILLTVLVKAATFPLTKKQVESSLAMRTLQPQIKAIQERYAGDQERLQLETARLYKLANINPLAGCLPTLATIPVWIGLYRALSNVADEGLLTEGFFWIPSLAGPTTIAARQNGSGISWLFPFVDGAPPLGWSDTLAYLVLPVLLIVSQYISVQIMQSSQPNDPNMKSSQVLTKFLPLMIGYFALSVPSGLSLYWLTNNILSTGQQVWLQKLGGAKNPVRQVPDDIIKNDGTRVQKSISKLNSTIVEEAGQSEKTSEGPQPGDRFKQLKEQEARRRQQREEEEKMKGMETAARETEVDDSHVTLEKTGGDLTVEKSRSVGSDTDPSISGVVNGNLLSTDLEGNQNFTSTSETENNEGSAHFNNDEINEKNSDKEPREVLTSTTTANRQPPAEDSDRMTKD
ncbi:ALBINO3-like protein 1, chloroplastic isoform X1 [Vigna umbellata]|uniref:ALBINO3-like protein 1, chloroplastic isoform X1 n=1 Tax=Vigna umbellata TaxID=87088 RepID=UPI001F5E3B7F|nr:ALBINO3-like protein 1, chloroplastic isoform X1 [Vigna umbellata]